MTDTLSDRQFTQYYRQILLPEVGEQGQQRLLDQHLIIVGIGGLGTHVTQQLAAAGIGHLYLVDDDKVETSNLPRQVLFNASSVGTNKVVCAAKEIAKLNSDITVSTYSEKFNEQFAQNILSNNVALKQALKNGKLMLLDCSDNMPTRQLINAWCATHLIPLISASVSGFLGQIMLIDGQVMAEAGCYHCVFSAKEIQQNCSDMGVLGPMVATVASMQALTTIRHILNIDGSDNKLHVFDGLRLTWRNVIRHRDPHCTACLHWKVSPHEASLSQTHCTTQETSL